MTDLVDSRTGELRESPAENAVRSMLEVPEGFYGSPLGPGEIEAQIDASAELIAHVGRVIVLLYEEVHRATEKYQGDLADFMVMHEKSGAQLARQYAIAKTKTQLHELNLAKEKLRYAEEMQKAVQNRSYGLMNINKRFTGGPR